MVATATPQIPVVNAGALYINGLQLSNNATTPNTQVDVAAGAARNSTNSNDIVVSNTVTLSILASGAGGLDTGTVAASTLYAVYVIGSSTNQLGNGQSFSAYPGTVIMSASFSAPVLPMGYDMFRRVGAILTDGSTHVLAFEQVGNSSSRHMWYDVAVVTNISSGASATYAAVTTSTSVPAIATDVNLLAVFSTTAAAYSLDLSYSGVGAVGQAVIVSGDAGAVAVAAVLNCPQKTTGLSYKVTGRTVTLSVAGYVDQL